MHDIICKSDLNKRKRKKLPEVGGGWLALRPSFDETLLPGGLGGAQPWACLSEQSEEDIDVAALGKQQPENISNPMYENTASATPEPSYDPFMVSVCFYLGAGSAGVQGNDVFQHISVESSAPRNLTTRTCLPATSLKSSVVSWVKPCSCVAF